MALGVTWQYDEQQKTKHQNRQIIVIGTDGIWQAHNSQGKIFGKEALLEIIRQHASAGAQEIVSAILNGVNRFRNEVIAEDDITLVVIKVATPRNTPSSIAPR